jgi:hypothetical protein
MAQQRAQNDDWWIGSISQLAGLIVLVAMFNPSVRYILQSIGSGAIPVLGLFGSGLIGLGVYRLLMRERRTQPAAADAFTRPSSAQEPVQRDVQVNAAASSPSPALEIHSTEELAAELRSMDWFQFEKLIGRLYEKQGYNVTRRGGENPDDRIDLIIEKNGRQSAIQCKQWKTLGVQVIREFLDALTNAGIQKGIFITLRGGTEAARQLGKKHGIEILNEAGLARMLKSTEAGRDPQVQELLRDTRKFCPKCERELVVRTAARGRNRGGKFWGCSGSSRGCRFRMSID